MGIRKQQQRSYRTTLPLSTHFSRFRDFFVSTFKKMKYAATMLIFLILIIIASSHQDDDANHRQADEIGQLALARRRRDAMQMMQPLDGQKGRTFSLVINARKDAKKKKKAIMASFLDKKGSDRDQD